MSDQVVAVDLGTSAVKAVGFDAAGRRLARAAADTGFLEGAAAGTLDAETVGAAVDRALAELARVRPPGAVAALVFSAAMHDVLPVDAAGRPLGPVLTWAFAGAAGEARRLAADPRAAALTGRTGVPLHAMSPLVKLRWLRRHQAGRAARRFVTLKSWLLHGLFGDWWLDHGGASGSGLYDLFTADWSDEALALAGVGRQALPELVDETTLLGPLPAAAARRWGLPKGIPVCIGGADGPLANLGAQCFAADRAVLTLGTSAAARRLHRQPNPDPSGRLFCYRAAPGHYVSGGASNNAGAALHDFARRFGLAEPQAVLAQAPPGAGGVLCLPHWFGERAPLWDSGARAAWVGLRAGHGPREALAALFEGIGYNLRHILDLMEAHSGPIGGLYVNGGLAADPALRRNLAELLGRPLYRCAEDEASARGAALLAWRALGALDRLDAWAAPPGPPAEPRPAALRLHRRRYRRYRRLLETLRALG